MKNPLERIDADFAGPLRSINFLRKLDYPVCWDDVKRSIASFKPDGKVDPGGKTFQALAGTLHVKWIGVFLDEQVVRAFQDGEVVKKFDCVTGDGSNPTNPGQFKITIKNRNHTSSQFGVKMNFAVFFDGGKALHQYHGGVPLSLIRFLKSGTDFFGSHGCVRLEQTNAEAMFNFGEIGTRVTVIR